MRCCRHAVGIGHRTWLTGVSGGLVGVCLGLAAVLVAGAAEPLVFRQGLVLESAGRAGRNTLFTDAVEAEVVAGRWRAPKAGEVVRLPDGRTVAWTAAESDTNGWFTGRAMRGGWACFRHEAAEPRVLVLNAAGHGMAYVNGEPRAGDIYQYGYVQSPVLVRAGANDFLLAGGRGRLRASLLEPKSAQYFNLGDPTTPDFRVGEKADFWAAVVVVNATTNWVADLEIRAECQGRTTRTPVPSIPPLGVRKVGYRVRSPAPSAAGKAAVELRLVSRRDRVERDTARMEWRVRGPEEVYKRTFVSGIDGSVQYYAVNPAAGLPEGASPALFLSFHGASVEALGQAESYAPKRWGTLVAPTNRRPYGFDWEEWGRLDALEVLDRAVAAFRPDPSRIYLTGHSMGGHGTWNFGATFPDRFAAIGPSAGWISFFSYAGSDWYTNATPVERMLRRSAASSDTLAMATNYLHEGVYVVHGDADDNVPVREARRMREVLGTFHRDVDWHEQPGAGHWWGSSDEPGAECVDWQPMFDFFARHRRPAPEQVRHVHFVTVNPGVSSRSLWLGIEGQHQALEPSEVDALWDPILRRVTATTRNVQRWVLEADVLEKPLPPTTAKRHAGEVGTFTVIVDGQKLENLVPGPADPRTGWRRPLALERTEAGWRLAGPVPAERKGPWRNGPFKDAFRHRMLFVYGTGGSAEENAWALAKARFDAESFWYRGNGSVEVVPDTAFNLETTRDRGVILYGHADMNAAWDLLLGASPVRVRRGEVVVGGRTVRRDDLACVFLQPRRDSAVASVGVVAGSGAIGLRLTNRLPYFLAGTGYPDCLVLAPEFLAKGTGGIVAAGFFGPDWSVDAGDFAWGDTAVP